MDGLFAGYLSVPADDPVGDGAISRRPLAAQALRPPASPKVMQERLNINAGCALVQASTEDDELILGVDTEAVILEGIPVLTEEFTELLLSGRLPPRTPFTELHVRSIARDTFSCVTLSDPGGVGSRAGGPLPGQVRGQGGRGRSSGGHAPFAGVLSGCWEEGLDSGH